MPPSHTQQTDCEIGDILHKRFEAFASGYRQNVAIIGLKGVGKTTLLFSVIQQLKSIPVIPIYIRLKPRSIDSFARHFIGVLLFQCLRAAGSSLEDNLDFLLDRAQPLIPSTITTIREIFRLLKTKSSAAEIFTLLLQLPEMMYKELHKPAVLIFDEFHFLEQMGIAEPFDELSNRIMIQKYTMYVLLSSAVCASRELLSGKLRLLFGNFEILTMEPMSVDSAWRFAVRQTPPQGVSAALYEFFIQLSGGFPFYLTIFIEALTGHTDETRAEHDVLSRISDCLRETLLKEHAVLNQYFSAKISQLCQSGSEELTRDVLITVACGAHNSSLAGRQLGRKTAEVTRIVNRLIQSDILVRRGGYCLFTDRLFQFWLKFILRNSRDSFNIDNYQPEITFSRNMIALAKLFFTELAQPIETRIASLLQLWNNDRFELYGKHLLLPKFNQVTIAPGKHCVLMHGVGEKKHWVIGATQAHLGEGCLSELIDAQQPGVTVIALALAGIEENARLRALEGGIRIWDTPILNELLFLYEKPLYSATFAPESALWPEHRLTEGSKSEL